MSERELDYNNLFRTQAEGNKEITLSFGAWNGQGQLTVFKDRKVALKLQITSFGQTVHSHKLKKILNSGPDTRESFQITKYDFENKKSVLLATVIYGRNEKNVVYMGVSSPELSATKFHIRLDPAYGSSEGWTEAEKSEIAAHTLIRVLEIDMTVARMNTSWKFDPNAAKGGKSGKKDDFSGDLAF